jgi:hypothetical protein
VERQAAKEYRDKFYPATGVYKGSGAGSIGSDTMSSQYGGAKTYTPYTSSTTQHVGGSTFNITNNNNINVNYGSNITSFGSEATVPTFQDLDKKNQSNNQGGVGAALYGTLGNIASGISSTKVGS